MRVLGSAFGWFAASLAITLLTQVSLAVSDLGGFCARGGPYEIAVECSDAIVVFAPTSIIGGLAAVFASVLLTRGFGVSLATFAWPMLFVSLGSVFLRGFVVRGDVVGLVIGIVFIIMGLVPLVAVLRMAPRRVLVGTVDARGQLFTETPATAADWLLSLSTAALSSGAGVAAGIAWFAAVATA